jgi:hypothetical protein
VDTLLKRIALRTGNMKNISPLLTVLFAYTMNGLRVHLMPVLTFLRRIVTGQTEHPRPIPKKSNKINQKDELSFSDKQKLNAKTL